MEQEEKRARKTSSSKTASTTKKVGTTRKTESSSNAKTTTKKVTSAKETPAKKASSGKAVTSKKASVDKVEPIKKVATTKSTPTKKTTSTKATTKKAEPTKKASTKKVAVVEEKEVKPKRTNTRKTAMPKETETEVEVKKADEPQITIVPKKEKVTNNKETKKEENKVKENNNKRYIDISVGAIVCVIVIIALVVVNVKLGKHAYGILKNQSTNSDVEPEKDVSVTQEIGNVIEKTTEIAEKMKENITFPSNVTASIYNTKGFDNTTITNELKLMMGWTKTDIGNKQKSRNENDEEVEALESSQMSRTIKEILGPDIQYIDEIFNNTRISTFENSTRSQGEISYADGIYKSILKEEQEDIHPFIYQEIQRVVKYSDKINVYVKVAFVDVYGDMCQVYKNFKNNKFNDKVKELKLQELIQLGELNQYTGEGTVTLEENSALDSVRAQLNTYKYTFTFDETTQEYYLSKFAKGTN